MPILQPAGFNLADVDPVDPRETLLRGSRLISSRVGIIRGIGKGVFRAQDPTSFAMGILAPDLTRFSMISNGSKAGGGGETMEVALAATIGESIERYCMYFYEKEKMVLGSFRELGDDAVDPELLRLYSLAQVEGARQKGRRRDFFDADSCVRWVWGYSLTHRRPRLVPASLVYMNYAFGEDEAAIGRNASSGLAAGTSIEEAILSGLLEVVERDAFTISWLHRTAGPWLQIDDPDLARILKEDFHTDHPSVDLRVFDITLDIPLPSVFGMMRRPAEFGPSLSVGSVTRTRPHDAVRKCLREIGQGLPYFRFLMPQLNGWQPRPDFSDLTSFDHHCMLYIKKPELVDPHLSFYLDVSTRTPLSSLQGVSTGRVLSDIETCLRLLAERNWEVIVADITTPDVEDWGFRAVRVLIPGLVPLHGNHNWPYLGVRRLHEIRDYLATSRPSYDPTQPLNSNPHPFP